MRVFGGAGWRARVAVLAGLVVAVSGVGLGAAASPRPGRGPGPGLPLPGSAAMAALRRAHGLAGGAVPGRQVAGHPVGRVRVVRAVPPAARRAAGPVFPAGGAAVIAVPRPRAGAAGSEAGSAGAGLVSWGGAPGVPVRVAAARGAGAGLVSRVRVVVASRRVAVAAGADGMLLGVWRADGGSGPGRVRVQVSYAGLASAYGGDFGARLALVALPGCALTRPGARACQAARPVASADDWGARTLTATVAAAPGGAAPAVLALAATASGGTGDSRATSLSPSSAWQVGVQSGDFTYSYPLRVPPPIAGAAPALGLSYDSQATDGETSQANSQPGQLGEGFSLAGGGFIERRYASCADHVGDSSNDTGQQDKTGDLCWDGFNAALSLGGHSGQLELDSSQTSATSQTWHLAADDGTVVKFMTGQTSNGAYQNQDWEVITPDGTQYWFGLGQLPGWQSGDAVTNSVWTVPVVGLRSGDPCHASGSYANSVCKLMPYRWNLDMVVDRNGNATSYFYSPQTSYYAFGSYFDPATGEHTGSTWLRYDTGGTLSDIYYGSQDVSAGSPSSGGNVYAHQPFRVHLSYSDRCTLLLSGGGVDNATCDDNHASAADWPDMAWDLYCGSSAGTGCSGIEHDSPAFFDTQMLTSVTTSVAEGASPQNVDTWGLAYQWLPGDSGNNDLALYSITHSGDVGGSAAVPAVTFPVSGGWQAFGNKAYSDGHGQIIRNRLTEIVSETGAQTNITYNNASCAASAPDPATNTWPCFPQIWATGGIGDPTLTTWFNKYTVAQVTVTDTVHGGQSPPLVTSYTYCDPGHPQCSANATGQGAAWHYDTDADLVPAKEKSYAQWRGYQYVHVIAGASGAGSETDYTYLRGMDSDPVKNSAGDWTYPAVTVTPSDTAGTTQSPAAVTDANPLNGFQLEKITYNGLDTAAQVSDAVDWPWTPASPTAATANQPWGRPLAAWPSGTGETDTYAPLSPRAGGGARQTQATSTFNPANGLVLSTDARGDLADASQERCTTYDYPPPGGLIGYPDEVRTTACGITGSPLTSDTKYRYDGLGFAAAPTAGNVTETDITSAAPGTAARTVVASKDTYDSYGRLTSATDALGNCTATGYVSSYGAGDPTTTVSVYAPLGKAGAGCTTTGVPAGTVYVPATAYATTATDLNPAWGAAADTIDASRQRTDYSFDPLGRVTSITLPGQTAASRTGDGAANYQFAYSLVTSPPYVRTQRLVSASLGEYATSYQIYDSLLRPRQTQADSELGTGYAVVTDTIYDSRGNVAVRNGPYSMHNTAAAPCGPGPSGCLWAGTSEPQIPNETAYTYDGAGRPAAAALISAGVSQWSTTWQYPGADAVTVTPPPGGTITTTYTDALGRTTEIDQYHSKTSATGNYDATAYSYAPIAGGATKTVTDAGGNTWTWTYDLLGRVVSAADPDTGTTTSTWNDLGQLTSATDAARKTISWAYDAAGRKTAEYDTTGGVAPSAGNQLAAWAYDTAGLDNPAVTNPKAVGQLASATSYTGGAGGESYTTTTSTYSPFYTPEQVRYAIGASAAAGALGGATYTYNYTYNPDGTVATQTYPAAGGLAQETVTYGYDALGLPAVTSGQFSAYSSQYATGTLYDFDNQPTEIDVGTASTGVPWSRTTYTYDPATRRLATAGVLQQQGTQKTWTPVTGTSYAWDPAGNLLSADDSVTGDNQCYTYDYLARLQTAWSQASPCPATPSTPPGGAGIGGPAPYQQTMAYDTAAKANGSAGATTGNITGTTLITGLPGAGQTTTSTSYAGQYPAYGAAHPHAPGGYTTTTNGNAVSTTSTWTPGGQLASTVTGGNATTYNWDGSGAVPGQLATTTTPAAGGGTATTSYRYGASGNLLLVNDAGTTTLYLPGEELTSTGTGTTATINATRYYTDGGHIVAARTTPNPATSLWWLFPNPQGTTTVRINTTSQAIFYRYYTPYGAPRGKTPWWPGTRGYIGGKTDHTTGLTNLGARQYNPATPAFISPDPILNPTDPTDLNPYSYAYNNPATNSDPTGLVCAPGAPANANCNDPGTQKPPPTTPTCPAYLYGCPGYAPPASAGRASWNKEYPGWSRPGGNWQQVSGTPCYSIMVCLPQQVLDRATFGNYAGDVERTMRVLSWIAQLAGMFIPGVDELDGAEADARAAGAAREFFQACGESFTAGTRVLLASGAAIPISQLKPGDKVLATNVRTGETQAETVQAVLVRHDTNRYDLTVQVGRHIAVIDTTTTHLFWDAATRRWVKAAALSHGAQLQTRGGTAATVVGGYSPRVRSGWMWDLTVPGDHDFYVVVGTPVLVHNYKCGIPPDFSPNITQEGLDHSFGSHAAQWFGGEPTRTANFTEWQSIIERTSQSSKVVPWSSRGTPTYLYLSRIDGKWFSAQFSQESGDLVTAFVPNNGQLSAILGLLGK